MVTVITKSVGATGRDYATTVLAEAASDNDLVTADEQWNLEHYDDADFTDRPVVAGATVDATRYRKFTDAAGETYSLLTDTGVVLVNAGAGYLWQVAESYVRIEGMLGESTYSGASSVKVFGISTTGLVGIQFTNLVAKQLLGTSTQNYGFGVNAASIDSDFTVTGCIGIGGTTVGMALGLKCNSSAGSATVYNCGVSNVSDKGFVGLSKAVTTVENSWSVGAGTADFSALTNGTLSNNASSDATSDDFGGTGHITSIVAADEFLDPANNDFRPKLSGQLADAGIAISGLLLDIAGLRHGLPTGTAIGPYSADYVRGGVRFLLAPPTTPLIGEMFFVNGVGAGDWLKKDNLFAYSVDGDSTSGAWMFTRPQEGMVVADIESGLAYVIEAGLPRRLYGTRGVLTYVADATLTTANDLALFDTSAAGKTATLPASPAIGDEYEIGATSASFDVTVGRNGKNINGAASDGTVSGAYARKLYTYVDATVGWWER